jgi:hypothetical protein
MEQEYINKITLLEQEIVSLKEQLSKYTNPERYKIYYEKNKDKLNNDKKRNYAKEYYEKNKEAILQKQRDKNKK